MKNVSGEICRDNKNTHFMSNNFFPENRTVYEIMWINVLKRGRQKMGIWRMRTECWIPKATHKHSEYVTRIAFLLQQLLHERA